MDTMGSFHTAAADFSQWETLAQESAELHELREDAQLRAEELASLQEDIRFLRAEREQAQRAGEEARAALAARLEGARGELEGARRAREDRDRLRQ